jgi:nicotinamide mononucleotide (NMN) deamidase PncC
VQLPSLRTIYRLICRCRGPTPEIVAGLATHVRRQLDSSFTLCESGTAGPTGNTALRNRTPGYVALAIASKDGVVTREVVTGSDDREANMVAFAEAGLVFIRDVLKGDVSIPLGKL